MIIIILGRAAQFILALVMLRVATTLLSPEEMGRVSLVLTTTAFFAMFLVNPVGMFINRRLHAWQASGVALRYLIHYMWYLLIVAIFAAAILPLIYMCGVVSFGLPVGWLLLLVCGSLIFNTINQTAIPSLNMLGDSKMFVLLTVATIAASFACAILLVKTVQETAQYWLLGLLLGQTLLAIFGTRILFARLHTLTAPPVARTIHKSHLQVLFSFAWPVAIAAGLSWVQGQGYRYIMDGQLGLAQLGLFVAGYGISAGMIAAFESVLTTYFQPRLYRDVSTTHSEQQAQAWHRYAAAVIPSLVLTVALIMMLAPELTKILLGQNFQAASAFVIWGGLAEAARVLTGVYSLIAHVHMRTRWLILPGIAGSSLSITLCAILIPELGAEGAGIGLALSGLLVVVLMHLLLARRVGGGVPIRPVMWAGLGALALWGMTLGLRYVMDTPDWVMIICMMGLIGSSYLGMQYLLLRKHLNEKRIA